MRRRASSFCLHQLYYVVLRMLVVLILAYTSASSAGNAVPVQVALACTSSANGSLTKQVLQVSLLLHFLFLPPGRQSKRPHNMLILCILHYLYDYSIWYTVYGIYLLLYNIQNILRNHHYLYSEGSQSFPFCTIRSGGSEVTIDPRWQPWKLCFFGGVRDGIWVIFVAMSLRPCLYKLVLWIHASFGLSKVGELVICVGDSRLMQ